LANFLLVIDGFHLELNLVDCIEYLYFGSRVLENHASLAFHQFASLSHGAFVVTVI
jgi:hypothetical protein